MLIPRLLLLTSLALPTVGLAAPSLTELTGFGLRGVSATALSRNGEFVVGAATSASGTQAYRWSASTGTVGLGYVPGGASYSYATGISDDGSVIVGNGNAGSSDSAFRWTGSTGMVSLGGLSTFNPRSSASAVSADGAVVSGDGIAGSGSRGFRWTQGKMENIGGLPGGSGGSYANGMSADGGVIVGDAVAGFGYHAFRWTPSGGMVDLGTLGSGGTSRATDVSDDGSVIVGTSNFMPFLWRSGTMTAMPEFDGLNAVPVAVSGDGTIVVGRNEGLTFARGYAWSAESGMQDLTNMFSGYGILPSGWTITTTSAVTRLANGDIRLVGTSFDGNASHAFVATVPAIVGAVPEPGTMLALAIGTAAVLRRRRGA